MHLLKQHTIPYLLEYVFSKYTQNKGFSFVDGKQNTYEDLRLEINKTGNLLSDFGIQKGDKVAILAANSPEWVATYMAAGALGAIVVPILPDFSDKEITHILDHSEAKVIFVSEKLYTKIPSSLEAKIVKIENKALVPKGATLEEFESLATPEISSEKFSYGAVNEKDLLAIIYTSGTTGSSKGVMLSHKNILWNVEQGLAMQKVVASDRFFSILPLSHTYENTVGMLICFTSGASTYYLDKLPTPRVLLPALAKVKPTMMLSVPLIIEKIYKGKVLKEINDKKITKFLYKIRPFQKLLNKVAGKKVYQSFGGKLQFFGIGGAKLDPNVEQFLHDAKFPYAIGYGMTETSPLIAGAVVNNTKVGSTGLPAQGVEVRLVKEKPTDKAGEIQVKGENVMQGYYKAPELTKEVFTEDGWLKTGDLAEIDKKGNIHIKGRIKTMIVGASGENIYPEEIESVINKVDLVLESLVVEQGGKLVAMVHLNMEELEKRMKRLQKNMRAFRDDAIQRKDNAQHYIEEKAQEALKDIHSLVNQELNKFSQIQKMFLQSEPFEKTPTKKIKRFLYNNKKLK